MNETKRTYPNLVAKIQVYVSNKTQNSNYFSLLRKSGSHKNMLKFMEIVYIENFSLVNFDRKPTLIHILETRKRELGQTVKTMLNPNY